MYNWSNFKKKSQFKRKQIKMDKYLPKGIDYTNAAYKQMFQFMYPMMRKRNCDCGYDPDNKNESNQKTCPIHLALSNPTFAYSTILLLI